VRIHRIALRIQNPQDMFMTFRIEIFYYALLKK